jgi:phosphocarrier protein
MMLGAAMGDNVIISAQGEGAEDAVAALCALVEDKFGEE